MINWSKLIIVVIGGLTLFLYGMNLMSEGLNKAAGKRIRDILNTFTKSRFVSFITGIVSTTLTQSSSAISVMVISLVKAKLLTFPQTFGILLGSGIGTTFTAQIIAFKITDYSLLFIAIGFAIQILSKRNSYKFIGSIIIGFGLLFFGLQLMSEAMYPLRSNETFLNLLIRMENPFLGIIVGFVFTALIQSSGAFIGIIIVLSTQGLVTLDAGIPLLLGANIGTTVTAIIASLNAGHESKRVAFAFFIINLIGVLLICWWIPAYSDLIEWISPTINNESTTNIIDYSALPRQIANAHTVFNVLVTIILFPFSNTISKWIIWIIPAKIPKIDEPVKVQYLSEGLINQPGIAISLAKKETIVMAGYVESMLEEIINPFTNKDEKSIEIILKNEKIVDFLRKSIIDYSTKISQKEITSELVEESFQIVYIVSELEEIADIISRILLPRAKSWLETDDNFSDDGKKELLGYHFHTLDQLSKLLEVFQDYNEKKAQKAKKQHKKMRSLIEELKRKHFERLSMNLSESIQSSKVHLEVLGAFRVIHSHIANMVRIVLHSTKQK
ncbi:Na/Pi cotransporter family protein [Bacteroidota bacterium]